MSIYFPGRVSRRILIYSKYPPFWSHRCLDFRRSLHSDTGVPLVKNPIELLEQAPISPKVLKHKLRELYGANPDPGTVVERSFDQVDIDPIQYLREVKILIRNIVDLADNITDGYTSIKTPEPATVYPLHSTRKYRSSKRLPRFPERWTEESLINYLKELTGYFYVDEKERITDATGLISKILTDLLRLNNPWTRQALDERAYNLGIRYFLGVNDIESARWLLKQMEQAHIKPSRETYHLFLWSIGQGIRKNPYPTEQGHPLGSVIALLKKMQESSISASNETWNLILQAMPMGFGKSFLIEEMDSRNIQLNSRSQSICVGLICEKLGTEPALRYILQLARDQRLRGSTLTTVIANMLKTKESHQKNVAQAFQFMDYAFKKFDVKPSASIMNAFLYNFSFRRRFAWQMGIVGYFESLGVSPNTHSYQHILRAALLMSNSPFKYDIVGLILTKARGQPLSPETKVLIRQAFKRVATADKFLKTPGLNVWTKMTEDLNWSRTNGPPKAPLPDDMVQAMRMANGRIDLGPLTSIPNGAPPSLPKQTSNDTALVLEKALKDPHEAYISGLRHHKVIH